MSVGNVGYSEGRTAPASITREAGHRYKWLVNGKIYVQTDNGVSNLWVEEGSTGHVEYLNDLTDVNITTPINGDALQYLNGDWINAPIVAGEDTLVGNSLFVSPAGKTVAEGAERLNLTNHFSSLDEAVTAAAPNVVSSLSHFGTTGTGYTDGVTYNVTGGTGVGLTAMYTVPFPGFEVWVLVDPGSGYTNGDNVVPTGGNNDAVLLLTTTQAVDTIYVYGDHTIFNNLAKANVKYHFFGNGTISAFGDIFYDNNGAVPEIYVRGDAFFNCLSNGRHAVYIQGADTHYDIECYRILGRGSKTCRFNGGQPNSRLKVETTIVSNLVNWTLTAGTEAKGTVEVGEYIDNQTFAGGIRNTLYVDGGALNHTFYVVGDLRHNSTSGQATVVNLNNSAGGFHITGDIYSNTINDKTYFWGEGTIMCGGTITVIGDIYDTGMGAYHAYTSGCNLVHTGNVYTSKGGSTINSRANQNNLGYIELNGDVISTVSACPLIIGGINGLALNGTFKHNGKVINEAVVTGAVAAQSLLFAGTGYPGQLTQDGITTTGGTGTGLTLHTTKGGTGTGALSYVEIQNPGSGYTNGDIVTVSGAGNGDATITIEVVGQHAVLVRDNRTGTTIFDKSTLIVEDGVGGIAGIAGFPGNSNVVVNDKIISNLAASNITNLVTGSSIYDDPNIQ